MRIILQRVSRAHVSVDGLKTGSIAGGLVILIAVGRGDSEEDSEFLADKIMNLRIFGDESGKMNLNLNAACGSLLVISQFTLYGECLKGRRPSFDLAASADKAKSLYEHFVETLRASGAHVETGVFQAHMEVELVNDGPVTLILDSADQLSSR